MKCSTNGTGVSSLGTKFNNNGLISTFEELSEFTAVTSIEANAFKGSSLVEIEVPGRITALGSDAFRECSNLKKVILNEGILTMSRSFYLCASLLNITIPSTMTSLGSEPFYRCPALRYIKVLPTTPPTISGSWLRYSDIAKVYVPDSSLAAYKAASGWSTYASRIKPMSEFVL